MFIFYAKANDTDSVEILTINSCLEIVKVGYTVPKERIYITILEG